MPSHPCLTCHFAQPNMDSLAIATKSMEIAGDICVYTNKNFVIEQILPSTDSDDDKE
jgi:ATP-dependent protease HslVU (ClpYQ) peptidase subunit